MADGEVAHFAKISKAMSASSSSKRVTPIVKESTCWSIFDLIDIMGMNTPH